MSKKTKENQSPVYTVENCNFTNNPPSEISLQAIEKLADAANNNALAIKAIAESIKGNELDCLLKIG